MNVASAGRQRSLGGLAHSCVQWERDPLLFQGQEKKNALGTVAFHIQGMLPAHAPLPLLALSPRADFERGRPISSPGALASYSEHNAN